MTDDETPWPTGDEELFGSDGQWTYTAWVNRSHDPWLGYVEGYRRAANLVVAGATRSDLDRVVYPVVFLYRQYVELALKLINRDLAALLATEVEYKNTHRLDVLWRQTRTLAQRVYGDADGLDAAESLVLQLWRLDPTSEAFRYPELRGGSPSLPESLREINLRQLSQGMGRLASFLECMWLAVSTDLDMRYSA